MSTQSQSVEELRSCIKESMEDTMERKCPFCLQNISPLKLLAHNRLCMYLWEEQLEMEHVSHVTHSEGILEKESKKRKLEETEFVGLQLSNSPSQIIGSSSSNASSSSSTILNNPSIASSSTNSSTTVLPFLDRERYYEETEHKKKKEKAKGLCCFDPKVCPLAKRKSNPQTIKIILHGMTINVCKIAHFTSNTTRALLIEKNKLAIQRATKASKAIPKTTACTECSEQCAGLFKIQSRDSQRSIDFCSMACLLRHMQVTKTSGWNAWVKKYGKKARSSATDIDSQLSQILADDDEEGEDEETDTHDVEEAEHMEQAENDDTESD